MQKSTIILTVTSALALTLSASGLNAAGGGGGSSPSKSTPRYDAAAEYQAGVAHLKAENYKGAVKSLKRSLSVAPRNANGQYLLGVSYMQLGAFKKASESLKKAVEYDSSLIEAHRDLAITYHKLSKTKKAHAALSVLVARQKACTGTCEQNDKLDAAIKMVKNAMSGKEQASTSLPNGYGVSNGKTSDAVYLSAVALINQGQYEAALMELNQAGREFGPHPDVLTYMGFANRKLQRFDTAEDYYRRALAVAPNHLGAIEYYGELKVERGDMNGARQHLTRLEKLCAFGCYEAEELRRWITEAQRT